MTKCGPFPAEKVDSLAMQRGRFSDFSGIRIKTESSISLLSESFKRFANGRQMLRDRKIPEVYAGNALGPRDMPGRGLLRGL